LNTGAIISKEGFIFTSSKRRIERAADDGCPLCRIILDALIGKDGLNGYAFQNLSSLPFLGRITLGLRAVPVNRSGPTSDFSNLQLSWLFPAEKPNWWQREGRLYRQDQLSLFAVAVEAGMYA
jgi:hypothetical protein